MTKKTYLHSSFSLPSMKKIATMHVRSPYQQKNHRHHVDSNNVCPHWYRQDKPWLSDQLLYADSGVSSCACEALCHNLWWTRAIGITLPNRTVFRLETPSCVSSRESQRMLGYAKRVNMLRQQSMMRPIRYSDHSDTVSSSRCALWWHHDRHS